MLRRLLQAKYLTLSGLLANDTQIAFPLAFCLDVLNDSAKMIAQIEPSRESTQVDSLRLCAQPSSTSALALSAPR
jgi:hypothetical protein